MSDYGNITKERLWKLGAANFELKNDKHAVTESKYNDRVKHVHNGKMYTYLTLSNTTSYTNI